MAQQVKDLALPLQWLGSLLWCGLEPWPGNFHLLQVWPKEKKMTCPDPLRVVTSLKESAGARTELFHPLVTPSRLLGMSHHPAPLSHSTQLVVQSGARWENSNHSGLSGSGNFNSRKCSQTGEGKRGAPEMVAQPRD